jgi:glycosyltransferase involved in cell wall biosynthesis
MVANLQEPLIVVGIPAYNEEKTIASIVIGAQKHSHIVVVCDDGSQDMTAEIAERLGAVVVSHGKNLGYGAALQTLFKRARDLKADVLVTLDSDGQHDPEQIPLLVEPIEQGLAEVVLGSRFMDQNGTAEMPSYRQFGVKVITKIANGSGKSCVSDSQSGFRAYSKSALGQLSVQENGMGASVELLRAISKRRLRICEVPISCKYSNGDGKKTSSENAVTHGFGVMMSLVKLVVEDRPLPFLGIPGVLSLIAGVFFGIWMITVYAQIHAIETNLALASIAFILIGFFLISTAITLYAITRIGHKANRIDEASKER